MKEGPSARHQIQGVLDCKFELLSPDDLLIKEGISEKVIFI